MAKYHIDPSTGPIPCDSIRYCTGPEGSTHFFSQAEAVRAHAATHASSQGPEAQFTLELQDAISGLSYEAIERFADSSPEAHAHLDCLIDHRAAQAVARGYELAELTSPLRKATKEEKEEFKVLRKDFERFKNKTASLVEAHVASRHYVPLALELKDAQRVGTAHMKTTYEADTAEWLRERFNSVGGSDVGCLAALDFTAAGEIMYWDKSSMKRIEASKLALPTDAEVAKNNALTYSGKGGALYRGTVWEARLRDRFVLDNPELTVFNTKSQYFNTRRPWQQVNFDGVLSDRADQEPNGILELKTGNNPAKWDDGIPLNYRAQVLYYLNATGYDYAYVGVGLNDGEYRYFKLNRTDPVASNGSASMETYINERVEPWFEELKTRRVASDS